ncbi:MAG: hypothetical protein GY853_16155 [PVC group bacterium]|nr:hypothetical protein [PVC group bacterium]
MNDLTLIIIFVSVIVTWLSVIKLRNYYKVQEASQQEQSRQEREKKKEDFVNTLPTYTSYYGSSCAYCCESSTADVPNWNSDDTKFHQRLSSIGMFSYDGFYPAMSLTSDFNKGKKK